MRPSRRRYTFVSQNHKFEISGCGGWRVPTLKERVLRVVLHMLYFLDLQLSARLPRSATENNKREIITTANTVFNHMPPSAHNSFEPGSSRDPYSFAPQPGKKTLSTRSKMRREMFLFPLCSAFKSVICSFCWRAVYFLPALSFNCYGTGRHLFAPDSACMLVVQIFYRCHLKIMPNALFGVFRNSRVRRLQNKQEKLILKQNVKGGV